MLRNSVSASLVVTDSRSGVMHLEFFVQHRSVDAVSAVAGSGYVPKARGAGDCIATRFSKLTTFRDSLSVIGEGGSGDLKVVRAGPCTRGVTTPRACSDAGVGGKRAGSACLWNRTGV